MRHKLNERSINLLRFDRSVDTGCSGCIRAPEMLYRHPTEWNPEFPRCKCSARTCSASLCAVLLSVIRASRFSFLSPAVVAATTRRPRAVAKVPPSHIRTPSLGTARARETATRELSTSPGKCGVSVTTPVQGESARRH